MKTDVLKTRLTDEKRGRRALINADGDPGGGKAEMQRENDEKECSLCGKRITLDVYTDRFYQYLCLECLVRVHRL